MRLIERWAARRGEPLCPFEADVGLGRLHRLPIRRRFDAVRFEVDVDEVLTQIAGHVEQLLDGALGIFVVAFAEVVKRMAPSPSTTYRAGQYLFAKASQIA